MIDRQEARSDVARIDPAADRWLHTANRARATTDPRVGRLCVLNIGIKPAFALLLYARFLSSLSWP
jgi:hypothetical protein